MSGLLIAMKNAKRKTTLKIFQHIPTNSPVDSPDFFTSQSKFSHIFNFQQLQRQRDACSSQVARCGLCGLKRTKTCDGTCPGCCEWIKQLEKNSPETVSVWYHSHTFEVFLFRVLIVSDSNVVSCSYFPGLCIVMGVVWAQGMPCSACA